MFEKQILNIFYLHKKNCVINIRTNNEYTFLVHHICSAKNNENLC